MIGTLVMALAAPSAPARQAMPTQASLDAVSAACHAPRAWLEMRGREIVFKADPEDDDTKIGCVLTAISKMVSSSGQGSAPRSRPAKRR